MQPSLTREADTSSATKKETYFMKPGGSLLCSQLSAIEFRIEPYIFSQLSTMLFI